jgi:hypothetical protein
LVRSGFWRLVGGLLLFGVAFGFVEAAVVVDLRSIYEPLQRRVHPEAKPGDLFPVLRLDELARESPEARRLLGLEVAREAGTILMLAGVGLCAGGSSVRGFAAFLVAFGVWDVSFYASLKLLLGWPASLWTWDLLFLIPVPWVGPVVAPLVVSVTMVGCGLHAIARDFGRCPLRPTLRGWLAVSAGGLVVVAAFCWDYRMIMEGGVPRDFPWALFSSGELLALGGYVASAFGPPRREGSPALGC